jgi:hypothetical protein
MSRQLISKKQERVSMRKKLFAVAILIAAFALLNYINALRPHRALISDPTVNDEVSSHYISAESGNDGEKTERMDEPQAFAEYHRGIRTRDSEAEPSYRMNYQINELLKARGLASTQALSKAGSSAALNWIERGPGNVSGRTRGLIVDPTDPSHQSWFVGAIGGGVWKTTDAGKNWQQLTNGLTNLAVTWLAMAASNPNVIYAGTGEGFGAAGGQFDGNGLWKSTDRGQTWRSLPTR